MYSCKLGSLALLLALSASHHFILLHCQEPDIAPVDGGPPAPPPWEDWGPPVPPPWEDWGPPPPPSWEDGGPPPPPRPPPAQAPIGVIAGAVIGSVVIIVGLFACFFIWRKRRTRQSAQPQPPRDEEVALAPSSPPPIGLSLGPITSERVAPSPTPRRSLVPTTLEGVAQSSLPKGVSLKPTLFTYEELELATNGFSDSNILGEGGFGTVHKGVFHDEPSFVAVKQLKLDTQEAKKGFVTEIAVINRIHHRHLVSLIGYCFDEARGKMVLVSEFIPNKTLAFHLHEKGTGTIDWKKRMKIAIGSAKGLAYLHEECEPKIIHRDIKATNILVDDKFEPKVADFGLARISPESQILSTRIMGTIGYLAPEYAATGNLTEKADVYSFGVVLLELITGRKPVGDARTFPNGSMVEWARRLLSEALDKGRLEDLVDSKLKNDYHVEEMFRMISCAANCVRHSAPNRPTMTQVVQALEGAIRLNNDMTGETPSRRQEE